MKSVVEISIPQSDGSSKPLIRITAPVGRLSEAHADAEGKCPDRPREEIRVVHIDPPDHIELNPIVVKDNRPVIELTANSTSSSNDSSGDSKIRADWQLPPWARMPQNDTPVKFQLKKFVLGRRGSLLDMFM